MFLQNILSNGDKNKERDYRRSPQNAPQHNSPRGTFNTRQEPARSKRIHGLAETKQSVPISYMVPSMPQDCHIIGKG